jgi:hypothetical protein
MPRNSRDRAFARLCARWLDQVLRRPNATPPLAARRILAHRSPDIRPFTAANEAHLKAKD